MRSVAAALGDSGDCQSGRRDPGLEVLLSGRTPVIGGLGAAGRSQGAVAPDEFGDDRLHDVGAPGDRAMSGVSGSKGHHPRRDGVEHGGSRRDHPIGLPLQHQPTWPGAEPGGAKFGEKG